MKQYQSSLAVATLALSLSQTALAQDTPSSTSKKPSAFVGVEYYSGESTLDSKLSGDVTGSGEVDFDLTGYKIKFGKEQKNGFRFQAYAFYEDSEDQFEEGTYGFGADVIKHFSVGSGIKPFLMLGANVGSTKLEEVDGINYSDDRRSAFAIKAGLGALFQVSSSIELYAGYDIQYRMWQDIEYFAGASEVTLEQDDTSNSLFAGFNFFF